MGFVTVADTERTVVDAHPPTNSEWDRAIRTHGRRVVVSLLAMRLSLEQAEEIAQRAWARIFEQHEAGRLERLELPGLVIRQARFFALELRRRTNPEDPSTAADPIDPTAGPEERLLSREQLECAAAAIETCTPRSQEVFRIVYQNPALPHAEVARRVGLSVQRVRQILCEVRRTVRKALAEEQS